MSDADPIETSDSQLKNAQRCPRRWGYQKLLKLDVDEDMDNLVFGVSFHAGAEHYVKTGNLTGAIEKVIEAIKKGKPDNIQEQLQLVPALLQGWVFHWLPKFLAEYDFVAVEEWFDLLPHATVRVRGFLDVVARKKSTGKLVVRDYKTTGQSGGGDLGQNVNSNQQLALYAVAVRRTRGEWPEEVGLSFIQKPKNKDLADCVLKARTNPDLFYDRVVQVTPKFAEYALSVEASVVAWGQQMLYYRTLFRQQGIPAFEHIPPNFNNCQAYGRMCGFADGCHAGVPAHRSMKQLPSKPPEPTTGTP